MLRVDEERRRGDERRAEALDRCFEQY